MNEQEFDRLKAQLTVMTKSQRKTLLQALNKFEDSSESSLYTQQNVLSDAELSLISELFSADEQSY
ncbi:hypothetical protein [Thaumasiovibrio sp. DFM-14]|uniref:hypothetical protein n=1 Tax=Thaumasiovibrio sp. DFM-14 TaxID=3384792 RepID=UPI00399F2984